MFFYLFFELGSEDLSCSFSPVSLLQLLLHDFDFRVFFGKSFSHLKKFSCQLGLLLLHVIFNEFFTLLKYLVKDLQNFLPHGPEFSTKYFPHFTIKTVDLKVNVRDLSS